MTDKEILNLAQAELRAMYKQLGINGSNVLTLIDEALRQPLVSGRSGQLFCPDCKHNARMQNGFIWCENDDCGGIYRAK